MINLHTFIQSLKLTWIRRLLIQNSTVCLPIMCRILMKLCVCVGVSIQYIVLKLHKNRFCHHVIMASFLIFFFLFYYFFWQRDRILRQREISMTSIHTHRRVYIYSLYDTRSLRSLELLSLRSHLLVSFSSKI